MNKLIKMVTLVAGVGAMLSFAGCGGGTPESVAKDVIACLKSADFEGASKHSTGEFKKGMGVLGNIYASAEAKKEFKKQYGNEKFEIGAAVIDGDEAEVPVKVGDKNKSMELIKKDGAWKVEDFNFKDM